MRRVKEISNIISLLTLLSGVILSSALAPQAAVAGVYNDISIVDIQQINDSNYSHQMRLQLDNRKETLLLNQSDAFIGTTVVTVDDTGSQQGNLNDISIFQGQIENVADSWVRLVVQGDEVAGIIDTGDERIHLNHIISTDTIRQIQSGFTPPFSQLMAEPVDPFEPDPFEPDPFEPDRFGEVIEIDVGNGFFDQPEKVTKVANIAIVVDSAYDEAIGGRGLAQAISTINAVDGIYREEFGLALKVETAIMVTDNDTLALGNISLEDNLIRFRDYRLFAEQISNDLALVHLFTGVRTADPSVGLAYIDTVCSTNGFDVSLSLPFRFPILLTAHEIGHNLGALHDDETNQCRDISDTLMFSHINESSTRTFSSCSADVISKRLEESTCHTDAIDIDVTLARQDDTGVIALVTNTDTVRAFPAATLALELEHATIASVPASCIIISGNRVECAVTATFAEESQALAFDLRLEENQEITISATLNPIGFLDVHNENNSAEIVIPQVIMTAQEDPETVVESLDSAEENPGTADATDGDASGGNAGVQGSGGGGSLWLLDWLVAVFVFGIGHARWRRRFSA